MNVNIQADDMRCVLGCLLLNYDFIYQSVCIVLDTKLVFVMSLFYLVQINAYAEVCFKYDYQ